MNEQEFAQKIRAKYPGAYDSIDDNTLTQKVIAKYPVYASQVKSSFIPEKSTVGTLLSPLKEGAQGLKTLYGGSEQGIARKLLTDVKQGAADIQQGATTGNFGQYAKGIVKTGGRVAGDIAGAIYAPVGAVIGATGINKPFEQIQKNVSEGKGLVGELVNKLTDIPAFQQWAIKHPNASEDFGRIVNLAFASGETGTIDPKTALTRTSEQISAIPTKVNNLRPTAEQINLERQTKLNKGFEEQNTRLKSADKSFNKNTIIRQADTPNADGTFKTETITPIDTFSKYNISPVIDKGSIQMGDYKTGTGELGKIKEHVSLLDSEIDTKLVNSGQKVSIETLRQEAINRAKSNSEFKQSGTVSSVLNKIENRFNDYKQSYGDNLDVAELNNIRKVANKDWSPDTSDVSSIVGDVARDVVYNVTPDKAIRSLLRQQGELLAAKKYAETINGTKVVGGKLGNIALRTTGAIVGSSIKQLPVLGPLAGAIGGEFASRALQQSQFKSAWTELRSLIQRSNSSEQIQSAKAIPKIDTINQSKIKANNTAKTSNTSNRIIDKSIPQKKGMVQKLVDKYKSIPNKQGGFVRIGGKEFKEIPEATKKELVTATDYINMKKDYSKSMEQSIVRLQEKYNIPLSWSSNKVADAFVKLIENTKTR